MMTYSHHNDSMGGEVLSVVSNHGYMGDKIHKSLIYKEHTDTVVSKAKRTWDFIIET